MVVSWSHLLPELWFIVFKHVQSIKTVAECRLVCKTWNPLAESAMVGKSLSLNSEERIVKFCNRLQENPPLRYYIRSLSFGFSPYMSELFTKDFFKLVMNPNIVSLDGWFDETDLNNLFNAVKESGEQYKKLESLISRQPWQNIRMGDIYLSVQLYFKTSLKDLCLSLLDTPHTPIYQTVVDHLDQFINLKSLL
ncbi:hypothetical protein V8B55DRAFT_1409073 [Mucor lusitanicus]|uniref:F-box domain-containing protein n=2 Tax=Mucor circinelloides f. lusitanicus TaxID=29924 RepID=A0A162QMT2_MUCCL|nr:hypothetical protein FB192DRAFT_1347777 [Mucor lusitanicus]OAD00749.1 hypothetical protein MUCCIDRAFT_85111 [Mucor lusitanicus CBS 277.49]